MWTECMFSLSFYHSIPLALYVFLPHPHLFAHCPGPDSVLKPEPGVREPPGPFFWRSHGLRVREAELWYSFLSRLWHTERVGLNVVVGAEAGMCPLYLGRLWGMMDEV